MYETLIYIVDRWCLSTFAYTIDDQTEDDETSIHNFDNLNDGVIILVMEVMLIAKTGIHEFTMQSVKETNSHHYYHVFLKLGILVT